MTASVFQSVLCPTDFSEASIPTFAHALRIAIGSRSELHLLNVARYAALDHAPLPLSTTPCTTTPPQGCLVRLFSGGSGIPSGANV